LHLLLGLLIGFFFNVFLHVFFFLKKRNNGFAFKTVTCSFVAKQSFVLSIEICAVLICRYFLFELYSNTPDDPFENQDPVTFDMIIRNM
jgi:hypothetical protein